MAQASGKSTFKKKAAVNVCNNMKPDITKIKQSLTAIETKVGELTSKDIWNGGTRSANRKKKILDNVKNSRAVVKKLEDTINSIEALANNYAASANE